MIAWLSSFPFIQLLILIAVVVIAIILLFITIIIAVRVANVKRLSATGVEFYSDVPTKRTKRTCK